MTQQLEQGVVVNVFETTIGDELAVDAPAGSTSIELVDAVDFDEDGGTALVADELVTYDSADLDTDTLALSAPLVGSYLAGDSVLVQPASYVRTAVVVLDDAEGEAIDARVPHALYDRIPEGTRDVSESVSLVLDGGEWVISDVLGQQPLIDASFLDETTIPPPVLSDGDPPALSPTPTAIGGVAVIHVRWAGVVNADAVTYEVHLSLVDDFTPDATTLAAETASTAITLKTMPNGDALEYGPEATPTTYFVKLIAKDVDDAAAPSAQDDATLYRITNEEVSALFAYFGAVSADQITAGDIDAAVTVSGEFKTSEQGQRVVMDAQGLHLYDAAQQPIVDLPTDSTKRADFKGNATMRQLAVTESLSIETAGTVAAGAGLELVGGLLAPSTAPSVVLDHELGADDIEPTTPAAEQAFDNFQKIEVPPAYSATHAYVVTVTGSSHYRIDKIDLTTSVVAASVELTAPDTINGIAIDSTGQLWVATFNYSTNVKRLQRYDDALVYEGTGWTYTISGSIITKGLQIVGTTAYVGYVVSGTSSNQKPGVRVIDLTTGAQSSLTSTVAIGASGYGFAVGVFDYGDALQRFAFNGDGGLVQMFSVTGTTLTHRPDETFETSSDGGIGLTDCIAWAGTEFRQFLRFAQHVPGETTTAIPWKRFTGILVPPSLEMWRASYAWRDSDSAGAAGTSLTDQGERALFTMKQRYRLTLTSGPIPDSGGTDDANAVTFYVGNGADVRTEMWQQGGTLADGVTQLKLSSVVFSGTNPAASNDFPGTTPGYIKSGMKRSDAVTPMTYIDGLGAAHIDGLIPPGSVMMWAGQLAPTGWAFCDGSTKSRTLDKPLYDAIGTMFGGGNGSTTFNLPNFNDKFPLGAMTSTGGTKPLANVGGAESANLPNHKHNTGAHDHPAGTLVTGGPNDLGGRGTGSTNTPSTVHTHNISGSTGTAGAATDTSTPLTNPPIATVPPYLAISFIIKL